MATFVKISYHALKSQLRYYSNYRFMSIYKKEIRKLKKNVRYLKEISSCKEWILKGIKKWYVLSKDFFYLNLKP